MGVALGQNVVNTSWQTSFPAGVSVLKELENSVLPGPGSSRCFSSGAPKSGATDESRHYKRSGTKCYGIRRFRSHLSYEYKIHETTACPTGHKEEWKSSVQPACSNLFSKYCGTCSACSAVYCTSAAHVASAVVSKTRDHFQPLQQTLRCL